MKANRVCLILGGSIAVSLLTIGVMRVLPDHIGSPTNILASLTLASGALVLGGVAWGAAFRESLHRTGRVPAKSEEENAARPVQIPVADMATSWVARAGAENNPAAAVSPTSDAPPGQVKRSLR